MRALRSSLLFALLRRTLQEPLLSKVSPKAVHLLDKCDAILLQPLQVLDECRLTPVALRQSEKRRRLVQPGANGLQQLRAHLVGVSHTHGLRSHLWLTMGTCLGPVAFPRGLGSCLLGDPAT